MVNKNKIIKILIVAFIILFILSILGCSKQEEQQKDSPKDNFINRSWGDLGKAISESKDGDTIYIDDIDFTPSSPDEHITTRKKEINKSITIKSGKHNERAVLTKGMFMLLGSKISSEKITVSFEDIVFDGKIETKDLSFSELPEEGFYSHAVEFIGNIECVFNNCEFKNYYSENGSVLEIRYDDYTANEYLSSLYQDQSNCTLSLSFNDCLITDNCSLYSGGAFYVEGNNNVVLTMNDTTLSNNRSSALYAFGGGAIYAEGTKINLKNCNIKNNQSNCAYKDANYYVENYGFNWLLDNVRGGGMYLLDCSLNMVDCLIKNNVGTLGGGIALTNTKADIDGCRFIFNVAERCSLFKDDETIVMPCEVGQGGALFADGDKHITVTLSNSYIYGNQADIAYGGIFQRYWDNIADPSGENYLKLNCCTYANNTCSTQYDYTNSQGILWNTLPGDMWGSKDVIPTGCLIIDDTFNESVFNKQENPSADNAYNYFASLQKANLDNVQIAYNEENDDFSVNLPTGEKWKIPSETLVNIFGDRYDGKLTTAVVGSNFNKNLYYTITDEDIDSSSNVWLYVGIAGGLIIVVGVSFAIIMWSKKRSFIKQELGLIAEDGKMETVATEDESKNQKQVVFVHFTEEQVDDIMSKVVEINTFTKREKEIFKEMLLGKKQSEIASKLYISTSTVKDFYQKIYIKMGVDNKDALIEKVIEEDKNK